MMATTMILMTGKARAQLHSRRTTPPSPLRCSCLPASFTSTCLTMAACACPC
ncbi:hypothetical protein HaLaN_30883, partial [Haematococcus lacustris]